MVVQGWTGCSTRCGHAYLMWLGVTELFPNLELVDKISTQLMEPCYHLKHAQNLLYSATVAEMLTVKNLL
jgi:hypothetical protein